MAFYEHVFIARQDLSAQQVNDLTEKFAAVISENGGKVEKTETWGLRTLAYRIKKNRKGHYVMFNLDAPSDALLELERQQRLNEDIIRYMSVRVEELEEGPSAVMQNKAAREERANRRGGDRNDRGGDRGDRGDRGGRGRREQGDN